MEILCPNCQRKLTILEQYAGQQMKCPLCANTFTAPALPSSAAALPATLPPPTEHPSASQPSTPLPPVTAPSSPAPAPSSALPPASEPIPTEHTGRFSTWISPRYTQFVPPALLFLVFILTFFPWVGFYPGGVKVDSQSGWQATFGTASTDSDLKDISIIKRETSDKDEKKFGEFVSEKVDPGFSVILLFYLLSLFANLVIAGLVVATGYVGKALPSQVQPYLRWRWAALALVTLVSFGFLLLESTFGFSLERRGGDAIDRQARKVEEIRKESKVTELNKHAEVYRGMAHQALVRTFWFRCAFWFHFWALVFVFVTMLADLRAPRSSPRVDLVW